MKNVIKGKLVNSMKGNRSLLHWYKGKTTISKTINNFVKAPGRMERTSRQ